MGAPKSDKDGVEKVYRALTKEGYRISVVDGAGEQFDNLSTEDEVLAEVMSCDDGYFVVYSGDERIGFVWFVYGNSPEEVVCDYSTTLSHIIDPLTESWW